MIVNIRIDAEPRLLGEIRDDNRCRRSQRIMGIASLRSGGDYRADAVGVPSEAGAQQKLCIAREELQDFHEIDGQRDCNRTDSVGEKPLEIALRQRALAEPRQRFLLPNAAAQLRLQAPTVRFCPPSVLTTLIRGYGHLAVGQDHFDSLTGEPRPTGSEWHQ